MYPIRLLIYIPHEYLLIAYEKVKGRLAHIPVNYSEGSKELILVPGHRGSWVFFQKLADKFSNSGYRVHAEWGFDGYKNAEVNAMILKKYILDNDLSEVVLLGHSKGGLIINNLSSHQDIVDHIRSNIIIASPYHGTIYCKIPFYGLSEFRKEYTESIVPNEVNVHTINVYPKFDNHVIPHSSLEDHRKGVVNIELDCIGHTRILRSNQLVELIREYDLL